ncbi:hypothetical protein DFJ74DRAFT_399549 [Hyaloraphidium curvatum]|nr:hypothetical protein DFJ74DRAFT_399549 [Hyaloraphidium curvatum]
MAADPGPGDTKSGTSQQSDERTRDRPATVSPSRQPAGAPPRTAPPPTSDTPEPAPSTFPPFAAALGKAFASPSLVLATGLKSLLKGYFKSPVRLFRPTRAPVTAGQIVWERVKSRARIGRPHGKKNGEANAKEHPPQPSHPASLVFPLVLFNSLSGLLLFQTYQVSTSLLGPALGTAAVPFVAGAIGGASQALVSTPLENLYRVLQPPFVDAKTLRIRIKEASREYSGPRTWRKVRWAYTGLSFAGAKDALGFSLFFGCYTHLKRLHPVSRFFFHPPSSEDGQAAPPGWRTKAADVLLAGSLAGAAFQLATAPLDRVRTAYLDARGDRIVWDPVTGEMEGTGGGHRNGNRRVNGANGANGRRAHARSVLKAVREKGMRFFFKGMLGQVGRAVLPSAAALGLYELAKSVDADLADDGDDEDDDLPAPGPLD